MEFKRRRQPPRLMKTLLFSYAVLTLLPLLLGIFSYCAASGIIRSDIRSANISLLSACAGNMDRRLSEIDRITAQIASSPQIARIVSLDPDMNFSDTYYALYETRRFMSNYSLYDSSGINFVIYLRAQDKFVEASAVYDYDFYVRHYGYVELENEEFRELLSQPATGRILPSQSVLRGNSQLGSSNVWTLSCVTYLKSIPSGVRRAPNAMLLAQLRTDTILDVLSGIGYDTSDTAEAGGVCIFDADGTVIACGGADISACFLQLDGNEGFIEYTLGDTPVYLTYTTSSYNGWIYAAAIPSSVVMAKAASIRNFCFFSTLVAVVLGLILLAALTYANSKPLLEIKRRLSPYSAGETSSRRGELYALSSGLDNLISRAATAESEAAARKEALRITLLRALTRTVPDNLEEAARAAGLSFDAISYVWLVSSAMPDDQTVLPSLPHARVHLLQIENRQLAALVLLYDDSPQTVESAAEQLFLLTGAPVGIGTRCRDIRECPVSFATARRALGAPRDDVSPLRYYEDGGGSCYYPIDLELRLFHVVRSGDTGSLRALTEELRRANAEPMTLDARRHLRTALAGTLYRLGVPHTGGTDDPYERLADTETGEPVPPCFADTLEGLSDSFAAHKRRQARAFSANVVSWLRENFADPNLSLVSAATFWRRSESTIAQTVRDETGETFLSFLERLRMEEAQRLLKNPELLITDIASRVGYASPQSFRRAFKRFTGVSPSEYAASEGLIAKKGEG